MAGTANDVSWTFAHNPAGQIVSSTRDNDAYAWTGHGSGSTASSANGLNQLASIGGGTPTFDARGSMTSDSTTGKTFGYSSENQLTSASGGATLSYDPLGRLYQSSDGTAVRRYQYVIGESGIYEAVSEYDGAGSVRSFHGFGPGVDEPMFWWDIAGGHVRPLHADERGSIVALSDWGGNPIAINRYDEFGKPAAGNIGRFQYTGQMWLPEAGLYHYKNRAYAPHLGQFMQTDPIGYAGGMNLYAYVGNDPVNWIDPLGLCGVGEARVYTGSSGSWDGDTGVIRANFRCVRIHSYGGASGGGRSGGGGGRPGRGLGPRGPSLPLTVLVPCNPIQAQMEASGEVTYNITEGTLTLGLLYSSIEGSFTTTGGYSGWFRTSAGGLFLGMATGVALGRGTSRNLATFSGVNYNLVGSSGPISISDNFSTSGSHVGQTDAASTPGLGVGVTRSTTELNDVMCPQ